MESIDKLRTRAERASWVAGSDAPRLAVLCYAARPLASVQVRAAQEARRRQEAQEQRRCSQGNEGGWITKNLANLINGSYIKISFNQRAELAAMLGLHYTCC